MTYPVIRPFLMRSRPADRSRRLRAARFGAAGLLAVAAGTPVAAQSAGTSGAPETSQSPAAQTAPAQASAAAPEPGFSLFGSYRLRQEAWDWFGSLDGAERYTFTASLLRLGVNYSTQKNDFAVEFSQLSLLNLPKDASLAPPLGQLGLGANYRDANGSQEASLFVKQAYARFRDLGAAGNTLRLGRVEWAEGQETAPRDPTLAWLKRERIAHRTIGSFPWSHAQRSFDGGQFVRSTPGLNLTFFAGMPTEGVFDLDGGGTLDGIKFGYAAATVPFGGGEGYRGEARLFGIHYRDDRQGVVKTDNRTLADAVALAADQEAIGINTLGAHYLGVWDTGGGKVDLLAWGAGQFGDWGRQSHSGFAGALELGWQPESFPGKPWFRVGYYNALGDSDPGDDHHGSYFSMLPTPRIYARFPFFTLMNVQDTFAQAIFRPHPKWTVRTDVRHLELSSEDGLWYAGGGAFNRPTFGYGGRSGGGAHTLANLIDLSVDYQWRKDALFSLYLGYAIGGNVIDNVYPGSSNGMFGYLEVTKRFQ